MPRRKYGRLQKAIPPPPPPEKCRLCKMGKPCPVHGTSGTAESPPPEDTGRRKHRKKKGKKK